MADSALLPTDRAANVCPVGAILHKRQGFAIPIGQRRFDKVPVSQQIEESPA
jgi:[NiFe] hydrogenase diaphorase moiety small subunit